MRTVPEGVGRSSLEPEHPRKTTEEAGVCSLCEQPYLVGARIALYAAGWSQVYCPKPAITAVELEEAEARYPSGALWDRLHAAQTAEWAA